MAKIRDLLGDGRTISFEFFPPKTDEGERSLEKTIHELEALQPSFVSVTYGAGGSTRTHTRDLVVTINRDRPFPAMAHLTCVGHSHDDLVALLEDYRDNGVENILALAGDPPADGSPATGDYTFASELVELIRSVGEFTVAVAAHPELHPRSERTDEDRRRLAEKLARADFGITQFFFDPAPYLRMRDELDRLGCTTPVLPGVMPPVNPAPIKRFADLAGARVPPSLWARLEAAAAADRMAIAVEQATRLCEELLAEGAPGLHLYTLNRSDAAAQILANLGLSPSSSPRAPRPASP
ncbi:MAG: methylenetetrahydrofolate reductase [Acidimicrobiales bacterium]